MHIIKRIGRILLVVLGVIAAAGGILYAFAPHPPATPKRVDDVAQLESYLEKLVAAGAPPSVAIAVVKGGEVVYNRAFGLADGPQNQPASPQTVYHWWSMTKIVTAMAVMQLQERGQLQLDDLVTDHLPWFAVDAPSPTSAPLTLRHLLNHSSGLPDTVPAMIGWLHDENATLDQSELVMRHLPTFRKLQFEPGSKATYSNLNYMVLGAVIEAVSGQSYEEYVRANILMPLGMTQTDFVYRETMMAHEAAGTLPVVHFYTPLLPFLLEPAKIIQSQHNGIFWLKRLNVDVTPPTGLIGSAEDMARLMLAYLNGGETVGSDGTPVRILSAASVETMSNASRVHGEGPNIAAYPGGEHGIGWYVIPDTIVDHATVRLQHHGAGPGFATTLRLYPEQGLGIVILANGTDLDRDGLADRLAEMDWTGEEMAQSR